MKRRHPFTLLETLVAFSLLALLLTLCFGLFRELALINRMTEQAEEESFTIRYVETRLASLFERLCLDTEKEATRRFFFYTEPPRDGSSSPSLIFTFNHGVRRDPRLSGDLIGRLYVNAAGELRLAVWPFKSIDPHAHFHEEVLCEGIARVQYAFYASPLMGKASSQEGGDEEKKEPPRGTWHPDTWEQTYDQAPTLMRMILLRNGQESAKLKVLDPWSFLFVLPTGKNVIRG